MYSGTVRRVSRQDIKLVTVSLEMEDNNTRNDLHKECFYAGGLSAYVSWLNANKKPLHDTLGFRKEMDGTTMEIALQWCVEGYADTMLGFANSILTTGGGTHIDGVKASITRTLNRLAKKSKVFKGEDFIFSWDHVRKGLTCIISVIVPNLEFEGQTQTRLGNQYLREFVDQSVEEYLTEYFELHPDLLERIIAKSLNEYKTALYAKRERERELVRSRSVSMPCAVPEKLPNRSSEKTEITIGGGDSSGDAGKHVLGRLLQSKRTREQPRRNGAGQCLVNTSESSFEKKRIITENCVPSASAGFSSRRTAGSSTPLNRKDVSKKTPEDVANCKDVSKKTPEDVTNRKVVSKKTPKDVYVPIGPGFQAEIPVWIAPTKKGKFYGSPGDSDTLRWLGTGVWPTYSLKKQVHYKKVGEGRSDSCSCASPRTTDCIKQHVKEARELLEKDLGRAFYTWNFDQLGEVVSNSWTAKEEQRFEALVKKNPISSKDRFWEFLSKEFPKKSEKDLISYYQNVFLIKRMRSLVNSSADHIDSDDDQNDDFLSG